MKKSESQIEARERDVIIKPASKVPNTIIGTIVLASGCVIPFHPEPLA